MKRIMIFFTIFIFSGLNLIADILDIPEVKVYGERKVEIKTINKGLLPFEKEYLEPALARKKKGLPIFEVREEKINMKNIGCQIQGNAGTFLGGHLLAYARENLYPLEAGTDFITSSKAGDSSLQVFSRTSIENFYVSAAVLSRKSFKPVYRLNIGTIHDIIDFDFFGVYSDSLIGVADINLKYSLFRLNLQFETSSMDYNVKIAYEEYPIQAGIVWFDNNRIYPELVFFLPIYDLYIKGNLFNKIGIAYLYCQSLQYLREYSSSDTYYRIELGQSTNILPLSLIYSRYLNNSLNYVGMKGTYREIFFEFEYPLESDYDYIFRAGLGTEFSELIYTNIFGYINGSENYFIGADLGYNIRSNLRIGIEGNYIYNLSSENGFDISGYVFIAF